MVCIAIYDRGIVAGCVREDGVSGGLDFLADCKKLGFEITYETQDNIDSISMQATKDENNNKIFAEIEDLEKTQLRPIREFALNSADTTAKTKIQEVEAKIVTLRAKLI